MSTNTSAPAELGNIGYEIFIGALSVLSIINIALITFLNDQALTYVVFVLNIAFSVVFLIDFAVRLHRAPSRSDYFFRQFGWADLLASLPFPQAKILRIFRLIRIERILRHYGARNVARSLVKDRAGSALLSLLLAGILVMEFGSLAMLAIEQGAPNANIKTASDALWFNIETMSTVGYGDLFPVTNAGRAMGAVIIIIGVGIFGTLTGYLANIFLAPGKAKPNTEEVATPDDARPQLLHLKGLVEQQQAAIAALELIISKK